MELSKDYLIESEMLSTIQNLIEYLNRNYFHDDKIEDEVNTVTKTLYDPEVAKNKALEIAKNLLDILDDKTIAEKTVLSIDEVSKLRSASIS